MVRYTKLPTILRYKVGYVKGKPSEEEYIALTLTGVSTVLLSVSLTRSKISATYFDYEFVPLTINFIEQNPKTNRIELKIKILQEIVMNIKKIYLDCNRCSQLRLNFLL